MDIIKCKARAKINLGLDVLGKLENGYHEVKMIMQTIDLYDELSVRKTDAPGIVLKTDSLYDIGADADNLSYKAAKLMREHYGIESGFEISLKKNIPVAAGMAGGSADAAATMLAINELCNLGISKSELMENALTLGADIPFCIMSGTALSEGIGERLTPLPAPPKATLVVVKPDIMVSTGEVYRQLDFNLNPHSARRFSDKSHMCGPARKSHPDIDGIVAAILSGNLCGITQRMENVLETVTETKFPIITDIKKMLKENGALGAMMSGSGPAIFGVFTDKKAAENAAQYAERELSRKKMQAQIYVTSFYNEA